MQKYFSIALAVYLAFYLFEGPIRYGLHILGADELIFLRDAVLIVPIAFIFVHQLLRRKIHPAYVIFILIVLLHGLVMVLNIGSVVAVIYSAKVLMTLLAGALGTLLLLRPGRKMLLFLLLLWSVSWVGIFLDKYYIDFPWLGMKTSMGDVVVEISRDWEISGEYKRAAGFLRSSIYAATVMPLLALVLMFNLRRAYLRIPVALLTIPALFWTTQKGSMVAYLLTLGLIAIRYTRPIPVLRVGVLLTMSAVIALPVVLSGTAMPHAEGVFSFSSFYQRVESMWPGAWQWIHMHEIFPFGVGLGGISGAQRLYSPDEMNAADNMFILMYAYFGIMSFIYLGAVLWVAMKARDDNPPQTAEALAILVFLFGYGCVISLLEDQMASLFLGAAVACLCHNIRRTRQSVPHAVPQEIYGAEANA